MTAVTFGEMYFTKSVYLTLLNGVLQRWNSIIRLKTVFILKIRFVCLI
jgi:hypothetical protein